MTEQDRIPVTPTIQAFLNRFKSFSAEYSKESKDLSEELMYWAMAVGPRGGALGEAIASQIEYNVEQIRKSGKQISVEEYLEGLFSPNPAGEISAEIIIGRFQLG